MGGSLFPRTPVVWWQSTLQRVVQSCQENAGERGKMNNVCLGESPRFISDPGQKAGRKLAVTQVGKQRTSAFGVSQNKETTTCNTNSSLLVQ